MIKDDWAGWLAMLLVVIVYIFLVTACSTPEPTYWQSSGEDIYVWRAQTESLIYPYGYLDDR